eukprot:25317-Chlamydomonas_euryale.AAC.1
MLRNARPTLVMLCTVSKDHPIVATAVGDLRIKTYDDPECTGGHLCADQAALERGTRSSALRRWHHRLRACVQLAITQRCGAQQLLRL